MSILADVQLGCVGSGGAGTKEWLTSTKDMVIVANDFSVLHGEGQSQGIHSSELPTLGPMTRMIR